MKVLINVLNKYNYVYVLTMSEHAECNSTIDFESIILLLCYVTQGPWLPRKPGAFYRCNDDDSGSKPPRGGFNPDWVNPVSQRFQPPSDLVPEGAHITSDLGIPGLISLAI